MWKFLIVFCFITSMVIGNTGDKLSFEVSINGEEVPYRLFSFFVMPGETLNLSAIGSFDLGANGMAVSRKSDSKYTVKVPEKPGAYKVTLAKDAERMVLNILVLTPMSNKKGEYLNGYRIGNYPVTPLNDDPIYDRPKGLFEITAETQNLQLTPNFNMSQFICKQAGGFPKYIIVKERLLLKLEYLLEIAKSKGMEIDTFGFISGYRTPFYNKSIGNVPYSRHVWGGAADIFIDQDKDGRMDDLNKDGKVDEKDVRVFYKLVEDEFEKQDYKKFVGGLGFYKENGRHSGFIHVDVRGKRARW